MANNGDKFGLNPKPFVRTTKLTRQTSKGDKYGFIPNAQSFARSNNPQPSRNGAGKGSMDEHRSYAEDLNRIDRKYPGPSIKHAQHEAKEENCEYEKDVRNLDKRHPANKNVRSASLWTLHGKGK